MPSVNAQSLERTQSSLADTYVSGGLVFSESTERPADCGERVMKIIFIFQGIFDQISTARYFYHFST